ncbi:hypothetical protein ACFVUY_42050 [Kitasatospora sp. NPDC058063]|uniref:hypothetical protein n=1 Tax=unclassified Kitasatospora TaxID=2633591 RepID=UPI0036DDE265
MNPNSCGLWPPLRWLPGLVGDPQCRRRVLQETFVVELILENPVRFRPVLVAALAVTAALLPAVPAHAAARTVLVLHREAAGETVSVPLSEAIAALPVAEENREGYERTKFKHWIDVDKNGCNTRAEVLIAEAVEAPAIGPKCALLGGTWRSPYDGLVFNDARQLDVDHVVPLAEAWDSK